MITNGQREHYVMIRNLTQPQVPALQIYLSAVNISLCENKKLILTGLKIENLATN